jgi:hypothetical protein
MSGRGLGKRVNLELDQGCQISRRWTEEWERLGMAGSWVMGKGSQFRSRVTLRDGAIDGCRGCQQAAETLMIAGPPCRFRV